VLAGKSTLNRLELTPSDADADGPYQLVVVPLLVGSELLPFVDRVLVIDCEEETQIHRLMSRDAETAEGARKILSAQASREARLAIADDVIQSEQTLDELRNRVKALDETYRLLAQNSCPRGQSPESS
jgi:dephospho-CoA kinase